MKPPFLGGDVGREKSLCGNQEEVKAIAQSPGTVSTGTAFHRG